MHEGFKDAKSNSNFEVSKILEDPDGCNEFEVKSFEGHVSYESEWGYLYNKDSEICKLKNECIRNCKHKNPAKLYVVRTEEGVVRLRRMNVNAKLPVRGTAGAAGYDLATVQAATVPTYGKCLVKTGLAMALPPDCYGRIAPRSGLALKKIIDIGAGVVDSDYRGELGVVLFNFGEEDFVVNMGDKIAQLIFEKIKTPEIKETNSLKEAGWGDKGYCSTGISSERSGKLELQKANEDQKNEIHSTNGEIL